MLVPNPVVAIRLRLLFELPTENIMAKQVPLETRLHAIRLHREHGFTILDAAKTVGAGRRSLIRWLKQYAPRKSINAFLPIVLDDASSNSSHNATSVNLIPVTVSTPDGSIIRLQLHSYDDVARLIRSLQ